MRFFLAIFFISSYSSHSQSASFDCTKAKSQNEKAICNNSDLGTLDEKLNATYQEMKIKFSYDFFKKVVQPNQLNWLKNLNQCTAPQPKGKSKSVDEKCLIKAFNARDTELKESLISKYGHFIFNGRVDATESVFQRTGIFSAISKDIFLLDSSVFDESTIVQRGRATCYYEFNLVSKSKNKNLEFKDIFVEAKEQELIAAIKAATFKRIGKPDTYQLETITSENIKERLNSLKFESLNASTFHLSSWPTTEGCAVDVPFEELPTIILRPYFTEYARTQLGL